MTERITWEEFREKKLLWFVNMIIHTFGYAIAVEVGNSGEVTAVYPLKVKYRGFSEEINSEGYNRLTQLMEDMNSGNN